MCPKEPNTPFPLALQDRVGFLLNEAAKRIRESTGAELAHLGASPRHAGLLATIASEGPLTQQALAERTRIDRTTMVQMVDELEKKKWVIRQVDPHDRRRYALTLTSTGKSALQEMRVIGDRTQAAFLEPLSAKEVEQLKALLIKLLA